MPRRIARSRFFYFLTRIDEEFASATRLGVAPDVKVRCMWRITPVSPEAVQLRCGRIIPGA